MTLVPTPDPSAVINARWGKGGRPYARFSVVTPQHDVTLMVDNETGATFRLLAANYGDGLWNPVLYNMPDDKPAETDQP